MFNHFCLDQVAGHEPGGSKLRLESKTDSGCGHVQRRCMPSVNLQQQSNCHRNRAHDGVEIGGLKGKVALASKGPFNAAGTCNAVHLPPKFAFKGGYPGHELETQTIVDHREATGGKR
jgi:hypothetical protein